MRTNALPMLRVEPAEDSTRNPRQAHADVRPATARLTKKYRNAPAAERDGGQVAHPPAVERALEERLQEQLRPAYPPV